MQLFGVHLRRILTASALFGFLIVVSPDALASCSDARIRELSDQGLSVSKIADRCDVSSDRVEEVIQQAADQVDEEEEGDEDEGEGLPRGAPVGECGCWGYPGGPVRHQSCKSGYAEPKMCGVPCPMGGYTWRGVCS